MILKGNFRKHVWCPGVTVPSVLVLTSVELSLYRIFIRSNFLVVAFIACRQKPHRVNGAIHKRNNNLDFSVKIELRQCIQKIL